VPDDVEKEGRYMTVVDKDGKWQVVEDEFQETR